MKTIKVYIEVSYINLKNDKTVNYLHQLHPDPLVKQGASFDLNSLNYACEKYHFSLTKKECLEKSKHAKVVTDGKYEDKKLYELPIHLKTQVSKMIKGFEVELK